MSLEGVDATVRALADPGRRAILYALRERDGQAVTELGAVAPDLGRHAVLKHLVVLQRAGLVTTRKSGRRRFVHLNPVPVVALAQRWLDDFGALAGLTHTQPEHHLETKERARTTIETRTFVARIVIAATPERIWQALTDPDQTAKWYVGTRVRSVWELGASIDHLDGDGDVQLTWEVIECVPNQRLVHTATWPANVAGDPVSCCEVRIVPMGQAVCQVIVEHSGIPDDTATDEQVEGGSILLLSAMKTLVETGHPLALGHETPLTCRG